MPVEDLRVGDLVVTRDSGLMPLLSVERRSLRFAELNAEPHLRPVMIPRGSLADGLPDADMMVSGNLRLLVSRDKTALEFSRRMVLVAAKRLVGSDGIREVQSLGVSYLHLGFGRHETVLANGVWVECFAPEDASLGAKGNAQRCEFGELFPDVADEARALV
jgi:hypothetical protein